MSELVEQMKKQRPDIVDLWKRNKDCTKCWLRKKCSQVVSGWGNHCASIMIVGEAPGYDEDLLGEPFVGRSGQLLTKLMKEAGIERNEVYITNAVKCRPPGNGTPDDSSITPCKSWLWQELQLIKPKVVLTLGKVSTLLLLKLSPTTTMKKVIGKFYTVEYMDGKIMPLYHPSYLLRQGNKLDKDTVAALKIVRSRYGISK